MEFSDFKPWILAELYNKTHITNKATYLAESKKTKKYFYYE